MNKKLARALIDRTQAPLPGRSFYRDKGCYNCLNWNRDKAKNMWAVKGPERLAQAVKLALELPGGENHLSVKAIRHEVAMIDHAIQSGAFAVCSAGKSKADLVIHNYLCDGWSGVTGARDAKDGFTTDMLPEELNERLREDLPPAPKAEEPETEAPIEVTSDGP